MLTKPFSGYCLAKELKVLKSTQKPFACCALCGLLFQLQSLSAWRTEVWACIERELYLLPFPVIFPAPVFSFAGHLLGRLRFGGKSFWESFLIVGLYGRKCGSRWVVEQDIHVNFCVNLTIQFNSILLFTLVFIKYLHYI